MTVNAQAFWSNMAWLAVAMGMVVMAFIKTNSLHSFWFIFIYCLGHSYVTNAKVDKERSE